MSNADLRPILVDIKQTCALIGSSRGKIYSLIKKGLLYPIKIGGSTRFKLTEIERFVENSPRGVSTPSYAEAGKRSRGRPRKRAAMLGGGAQ